MKRQWTARRIAAVSKRLDALTDVLVDGERYTEALSVLREHRALLDLAADVFGERHRPDPGTAVVRGLLNGAVRERVQQAMVMAKQRMTLPPPNGEDGGKDVVIEPTRIN